MAAVVVAVVVVVAGESDGHSRHGMPHGSWCIPSLWRSGCGRVCSLPLPLPSLTLSSHRPRVVAVAMAVRRGAGWSHTRDTGGSGSGSGGRRAPAPAASTQRVASSAEVFQAAESLRSQLEADLSEYLLGSVFDPNSSSTVEGGQEQDLESSTALARSLQVQCCELVGQLLVLLRVLAANLARALTQQHRARGGGSAGGKISRMKGKRGGGSTVTGTGSGAGSVPGMCDGEAALQSGLLLLSRLAWLLRTPQGAFLECSLLVQQPPSSASVRSSNSPRGEGEGVSIAKQSPAHHLHQHQHHHQQYMTSLEQLQSAFDIADTDGDGVITFAEAMEVGRFRSQVCHYCANSNAMP